MDDRKDEKAPPPRHSSVVDREERELVNTSGHVQEIDRSFSRLSVSLMGFLSDNAWGAGAGTLVVSLYNGGGPGVMYGLIASVVFYSLIGASLAELASALPTSANVYHWSSVTAGPKYGRILSFYAGWWNVLAYSFGGSGVIISGSNSIAAIWSLYHPDYEPQRWQVYIIFLVFIWAPVSVVMFGQRILSRTTTVLGVLLFLCWLIILLVCAIMPSLTSKGYAPSSFVWSDFQNLTGWSSDGLVFVMGILNGAFAIGTPDAVTHVCEEVSNPRKAIPFAIFVQMSTGTITTFLIYVVLLYGITDLPAVFNTRITALPLAAIIEQCTRSKAITAAMLVLFTIGVVVGTIAGYVVSGRMLWTMARDNAMPFARHVRKVDRRFRNPFVAQALAGAIATVIGAIYVGNETAFTAFVGCFVVLTTWSYCAAILPHILSGRRNVRPGPFWMPAWLAYPVHGTACAYILIFNVLYMFPYVYPTNAVTMNYACVMAGGLTILLTPLYIYKRTRGYVGPKVVIEDAHDDVIEGIVGLSAEEEERIRAAVVGY